LLADACNDCIPMQTLQVMAAKVTLRTPDGDETIEVR